MPDMSNKTAAEYLRVAKVPITKVTLAACKAGIYGDMVARAATPEQEQAGQVFTGNED